MALNFIVSPAIIGKFKVINTDQPIYHSKIGKFDFRTITEQEAQKLVENGSIYIRKINKRAVKNQ